MVTIIKIVKTKNGVSKNFIFEDGEVKSQGRPQVSQKASLTFAKDEAGDATEAFTVNLGVKQELNFVWKIYDQTTERSEGTNTDVKTYGEILDYLEDIICYPGIGVITYTITVTDKFRTRTYICDLEDYNNDVDSGLYPTGNMKFTILRKVV